MKKPAFFHFLAFLLFSFLAFYLTYPLVFHLGDKATGLGDELVIAWIHNWVIHALSTNPFSLFQANLYFPYDSTLAYSDIFFTSSIIAAFPLALLGQPIVVVNVTLISSLLLLGFSIYLLCFFLTKDAFASFFGGALVMFAPAVLDKTTHLQALTIYWVPLAILFFIFFLKSGRSFYLTTSLLFFLLQTYNSFLPGYFILFSYALLFSFWLLYKKQRAKLLFTKKHITFIAIAFFLLLPIIIPYYQVSQQFSYVRDIRDAIHFALQPEDLLYPSSHTRLHDFLVALPINKVSQNNEFKPGYLGVVFTLLGLFALWYALIHWKKKDFFLNSFTAIGLFGLVLSFGPVLHLGRQTVHTPFLIPLPYALFYYVLPGFQGFRNAARWEMLFILCMAVIIAITLQRILKKLSPIKRYGIYGVLLVGCIIEFNFPMTFRNVLQKEDFPKVFRWLVTTPPDTAVIVMPAYNWNMTYASDEMLRDYYAAVHFRRTVNGYTGFSPPPWQELLLYLQQAFPSQESVERIRLLGVDYIIVDKKGYDKSVASGQLSTDGQTVIARLQANASLRFVDVFDEYYIFAFSSR